MNEAAPTPGGKKGLPKQRLAGAVFDGVDNSIDSPSSELGHSRF